MLLDEGLAGNGQIIILQPRRLPTRMLAARVAHERNVRLGEEVGYQIRLDNVSTARTRIRFVTEGVLLRQMVGDPRLTGVTVLIFDEFHERHLYGDIALARALEIQASIRPDLKIVVMSATLDTDLLEAHLRPCNVLTSQGRTFPVEIEYLKRETIDEPPWEVAADAFAQAPDDGGDVLIFMPGAFEIGAHHPGTQTLRFQRSRVAPARRPLPKSAGCRGRNLSRKEDRGLDQRGRNLVDH